MIGLILVILASLLWAVDTLIRYPLIQSGVPATEFVFFEHLYLVLILLAFKPKELKVFWSAQVSHLFSFAMVGCVGSAIATIAFTQAFWHLNPSLVIILQKFQPIVAIILAWIILGEKISKDFLLWFLVCLVGAALISYEDLSALIGQADTIFKSQGPDALKGYVLVAISVLGWGSATVFGKKLSSAGYNNRQIMLGRFGFGLAAIIPFVSQNPGGLLSLGGESYVKILMVAVLSGIIAMSFYYSGLRKIPAKIATLAEMFFPFCAVIVNWFFLGASLTLYQLIGGALLIMGSIIAQGRQVE